MVARPSPWGPDTGPGTSTSADAAYRSSSGEALPSGSRRHVSAAECRLAQPGILLDMVGPGPEEHARTDADALRRPDVHVETGSSSWIASAIPVVAGAAAIGAFLASLVLLHEHALQQGAILPAQNWLRSLRDWLPIGCIGFGIARLTANHSQARTAVRGLGIGIVFALATSMAWKGMAWIGMARIGDDLSWMQSAVAFVIGAALGLHCESARRAGRTGVLLAGGGAALAATAVHGLPAMLGSGSWAAADALGVALCMTLGAMVFDAPRLPPPSAMGRQWRWIVPGWLAVLGSAAIVASQCQPAQWVLLSTLVAVIVAAAGANRVALALGAAVATLSLTSGWWFGPASAQSGDYVHVLRTRGDAVAVYQRQDQEMQLRLDGEVVAAAGPNRSEEPLLAAIVHAGSLPGDRVLLLGEGTGRVAASLARAGQCEVESAIAWPDLAALRATAQADGPVLLPDDPEQAVPGAWHKALAQLPSGSRQFVVMGELAGRATAHRASVPFQRQLRRVADGGWICQPIALDRIPAALLASWFDVVTRVHAWNGLYAVGNAGVLISGARAPGFRPAIDSYPAEARWAMHAAHLIGPEDLDVAFLGALQRQPEGAPVAAGGRDIARLLMRWLEIPESVPPRTQRSLYRLWQKQREDMARAKARLLTLSNDAAGRAQAQSIAARFLPMGAPAPWLQAALGLAGEDEVALRTPSLASRCAYAMDPTFFLRPAAIYASLPLPMQERGDLEDLFQLGEGAALRRRCVGDTPRAVALRARFPSRCARSLVAALTDGPLEDDAALALRELADPFVLREIANVVLPAGRWRELLQYWRADLPQPEALSEIAKSASLEDRRFLATALRGRRDPSIYPTIAGFLVADDVELRRRAGLALQIAVGELVPFDPQWPRSRRLDAATRLRDLHNRRP